MAAFVIHTGEQKKERKKGEGNILSKELLTLVWKQKVYGLFLKLCAGRRELINSTWRMTCLATRSILCPGIRIKGI